MKYVWITSAVIIGLVLIVLAVGYSLPVKHQASAEATYKTSPDSLFALISTVDAFPTWRTDVKSAEVLQSADGKRRFRETSGDGTITYLVDSVDPNRKMVTRIDETSLPFGGAWTYELIPAAGGRTTLRITEDGEVYNPIFRFVSKFMMGHDGTIKKYLAAVEKRFPG